MEKPKGKAPSWAARLGFWSYSECTKWMEKALQVGPICAKWISCIHSIVGSACRCVCVCVLGIPLPPPPKKKWVQWFPCCPPPKKKQQQSGSVVSLLSPQKKKTNKSGFSGFPVVPPNKRKLTRVGSVVSLLLPLKTNQKAYQLQQHASHAGHHARRESRAPRSSALTLERQYQFSSGAEEIGSRLGFCLKRLVLKWSLGKEHAIFLRLCF